MASAAPRTLADVRRRTLQLVSDSPPLSAVEKTALNFCRERAAQGLPVTRADIAIAIGSQNLWGGTAPGVLNRLEEKGYITRTFYQRGVQVCIAETGECTAPPACRATHWRHRKKDEDVVVPPVQELRSKHPSAMGVIIAEAGKANVSLHDFLQDLVINGLDLWLEKREDEEYGEA